MKPHWKLIAFELILEIVIELSPASLSMTAAIAQYLVELSQAENRASVQLIVKAIGSDSAQRGSLGTSVRQLSPLSWL